jgi:predicted Zn-dependent protease
VAAPWTNGEIELVAERAYQLHLQGKHLDAAIIFEGLLAIDPHNVYCLEAMAALSLKLGSPEDTLEYADRVLAFSPNQVEALACRCEANVLLNRFAEAQQDLESMKQLRAKAHVARLTMRIANAGKNSSNLLPDATVRQLDR